jgi:hypothetical protein
VRIENDLLIMGQCMFVQCDAIAVKKDRWSDPEIEIDNLLVDGEKPNEELAEQVYAVIGMSIMARYWNRCPRMTTCGACMMMRVGTSITNRTGTKGG